MTTKVNHKIIHSFSGEAFSVIISKEKKKSSRELLAFNCAYALKTDIV